MNRHIEDDNQEEVIRWCELNKTKYPQLDMIFAIPNGGRRNVREAVRLKRQGVKAGVPDLFLACTSCSYSDRIKKYSFSDFNGLFIEMKAGKNKPTKSQSDWHIKLKDFGYRIIIAYSWTEAVNEIIDYLGLPNRLKV